MVDYLATGKLAECITDNFKKKCPDPKPLFAMVDALIIGNSQLLNRVRKAQKSSGRPRDTVKTQERMKSSVLRIECQMLFKIPKNACT